MPIDASIIGRLETPKFDPMAVVGKATEVGKGLLSNRLLGQEIGAKEALGRAVTGATDAATGQTNWQGALGAMSQDPQGAFGVPALAASVQEREAKSLSNQKAALDLAEKRWTKVGDTAVGLLGSKTPLTKEAVIAALKTNIVASGMFNDPDSAQKLTDLVATLPQDDAGIRATLKQLGMTATATLERIQTLNGPVSSVDTGGNVVQQQISPLTGEVTTIGAVGKERTPTERAVLVPKYDPATGKTTNVRSGEIMGDDPAGQKKVAVQSAPALGEPEAASQGLAQAQAWRTAADKAPENIAALKNIRTAAEQFTPGPKTGWMYQLNALRTQFGMGASAKVLSETAAQEEYNKLATQFVGNQIATLGGTGTDAKLESAAKGSPSEFMSKEGIKGVTALMMGLNQAAIAKNEAWQKWLDGGNGPGTAGRFQTEFNRRYNPRVFQAQFMDAKQQQAMLRSMTADERAQFKKDEILARRYGWVK